MLGQTIVWVLWGMHHCGSPPLPNGPSCSGSQTLMAPSGVPVPSPTNPPSCSILKVFAVGPCPTNLPRHQPCSCMCGHTTCPKAPLPWGSTQVSPAGGSPPHECTLAFAPPLPSTPFGCSGAEPGAAPPRPRPWGPLLLPLQSKPCAKGMLCKHVAMQYFSRPPLDAAVSMLPVVGCPPSTCNTPGPTGGWCVPLNFCWRFLTPQF